MELRAARANAMFLQWRRANLDKNARRKALNEVAKTRIDLEVKDLKEMRRHDQQDHGRNPRGHDEDLERQD